jgi:transposase InsO family protein
LRVLRPNTDQGVQSTAEAFAGRSESAGVAVSMDGRGRALDNVFVERLWRSVKHEDVYIRGCEEVPGSGDAIINATGSSTLGSGDAIINATGSSTLGSGDAIINATGSSTLDRAQRSRDCLPDFRGRHTRAPTDQLRPSPEMLGSGDAIYERAVVKRGRCRFRIAGRQHIPFRRRLRSIWPISDLSAHESVVQPAAHPLSPRPRESYLPLSAGIRRDREAGQRAPTF